MTAARKTSVGKVGITQAEKLSAELLTASCSLKFSGLTSQRRIQTSVTTGREIFILSCFWVLSSRGCVQQLKTCVPVSRSISPLSHHGTPMREPFFWEEAGRAASRALRSSLDKHLLVGFAGSLRECQWKKQNKPKKQ